MMPDKSPKPLCRDVVFRAPGKSKLTVTKQVDQPGLVEMSITPAKGKRGLAFDEPAAREIITAIRRALEE